MKKRYAYTMQGHVRLGESGVYDKDYIVLLTFDKEEIAAFIQTVKEVKEKLEGSGVESFKMNINKFPFGVFMFEDYCFYGDPSLIDDICLVSEEILSLESARKIKPSYREEEIFSWREMNVTEHLMDASLIPLLEVSDATEDSPIGVEVCLQDPESFSIYLYCKYDSLQGYSDIVYFSDIEKLIREIEEYESKDYLKKIKEDIEAPLMSP